MSQIQITSEPNAPHDQRARLSSALEAYNLAASGDSAWWPIYLFLRDNAGEIRGGLLGEIWGGAAHIAVLWIEESLRRQGYGSRLLAMAEDAARARGCRFVYLDTHSYEAPDFYKRHGYEVFGVLEDYPAGHNCYFMKKTL